MAVARTQAAIIGGGRVDTTIRPDRIIRRGLPILGRQSRCFHLRRRHLRDKSLLGSIGNAVSDRWLRLLPVPSGTRQLANFCGQIIHFTLCDFTVREAAAKQIQNKLSDLWLFPTSSIQVESDLIRGGVAKGSH
jgi:hypothetical protein